MALRTYLRGNSIDLQGKLREFHVPSHLAVAPTGPDLRSALHADLKTLSHGQRCCEVLGAVGTRRAILWDRGYRTKTGSMTPTVTELFAFLETNSRLRGSAEIANKPASKTLLPASVIGLYHWLFSGLDPDEAGHFLARLADGDGLAADDPISALQNRIVKMRVGGGRVNETEALALVIMAWNARRAGETRSKLQLPRGGLTSENFPEPAAEHRGAFTTRH